jgi:phosphotriesterase-related protein
MPFVETTSGPTEVADLGRTMSHEHLHVGAESLRFQWPHHHDTDRTLREKIVKEVRRAQEHGVRTICDPSCMYLDRNVRINLDVAAETGMQFVIATGIYGEAHTFVPSVLHSQANWEDIVLELFLHDLQEGVQGTGVKAAFLKCAADSPGMTPDIETIHRAAARASLETGAPIMAHSNPKVGTGLLSMAIFDVLGVDPARVVIAHTGDTDDLDYIERLLDTGCYIGMDRYGTGDLFVSDEKRNETVLALIERGYGSRMMLGHDSVAHLDYPLPEGLELPDWHITHIFDSVIPDLTAAGADPEVLDAMVGANVHAWLAGRGDAVGTPGVHDASSTA